MAVCKENLLKFLKEDTVDSWARFLKTDIRIIEKLLDGTGTIHVKTAQKIVDRINERTGDKFKLDTFFHLEELKGYEKWREIIVEYGKDPMDTEEWVSIVHFVLTKKFRGVGLLDVLLLLLLLGIILVIILKVSGY